MREKRIFAVAWKKNSWAWTITSIFLCFSAFYRNQWGDYLSLFNSKDLLEFSLQLKSAWIFNFQNGHSWEWWGWMLSEFPQFQVNSKMLQLAVQYLKVSKLCGASGYGVWEGQLKVWVKEVMRNFVVMWLKTWMLEYSESFKFYVCHSSCEVHSY